MATTLRTARFASHMVTLAVLVFLGGLAFWMHADQGLAMVVITAVAAYGGSYQVAGAAHDSSVRKALIEAATPPQPQPLEEAPRP